MLFRSNNHLGTLAGGLGCFPFDYGSYHSQSDSHRYVYGIRSLSGFGNPRGPLVQTVLYLHDARYEAIPKYISERTSYLQVRLEFHPYPQLIRSFFNISRFGPPSSVTWTSTWSWVDHLVSGLHTHTIRPFQTRFRYGSTFPA